MTNFGLTNSYHVHDSLDQGKAGHSSFFAAGVFIDDTIWVGSSQSATQHILNIASEFFWINNISINNDKTVVIPINNRISDLSLFISSLPISITKKGESHQYLGIFFSTESFSKPSLARAHSDFYFFINLVLKKTVSDKQFLYLVSAVFHPIVKYKTQFSFVPVGVYNKWDALIHKDLKLKSGFLLDFPSDTIHHPFFYGLKFFSQCQSKGKVVLLISFANSGGILGHLFSHRSYDLQLSLNGSLASSFWFHGEIFMSVVLGESLFYKFLPSLWCYSIVFVDQLYDHYGCIFNWHTFKQWKRLNPHGLVLEWFKLSVVFFMAFRFFPSASAGVGPLDICGSNDFVSVCDHLSRVSTNSLSVYTNGLLKNLGTIGCRARAAAFFENINLGLGVGTIALALECVLAPCSVHLFSDSQVALDACRLKSDLVCSNFHNQCWVKCRHIRNVICIKGHSGILGNNCTNSIANAAFFSGWYLPFCISGHFLLADGGVVSGNSRHFVHDVFHAICHAHWEVGSGFGFLDGDLHSDVDWLCSSRVWHPDLHMVTGFTSRLTADNQTYFIKALHH
ncbi:hypothetical protein G9A89_019649 [Geosiphon pyriformis]|nr:hypothetical protein G9A89_019649 [Geosiphon pyriformis]